MILGAVFERFAADSPVSVMVRASLGGGGPDLLPGSRVKILDGHHRAHTEHRLKELRTTGAGPLPGHCLVVFDPALSLVTDVVPCEDGQAHERSLIGQVVATVQPGEVWIATSVPPASSSAWPAGRPSSWSASTPRPCTRASWHDPERSEGRGAGLGSGTTPFAPLRDVPPRIGGPRTKDQGQ